MATFKASYPAARRDEVVDDLFGTEVPDPYRWLEDPKSNETQEFVKAQNSLADEYMAQFPHLEDYRASLTNAVDYERYGTPFRRGNTWYYCYNGGLDPHSLYYMLDWDEIDSAEKGKVFFDPNALSEDGTVAINTMAWTYDATIFAYAVSKSGSDWAEARFRNTVTGEDYPETIRWLKFACLSFTHDKKGCFYQRYPAQLDLQDAGTETEALGGAMLSYHVLGTDQSQDIMIYKEPSNPSYTYSASVTFDGLWVKMTTRRSTAPVNRFWLAKLDGWSVPSDGVLDWIRFQDTFDFQLNYITHKGVVFYFRSNDNAPRGKVVRHDITDPSQEFVTIVPEQPQAVLQTAVFVNDKYLVLTYLHNLENRVIIADLEILEGAICGCGMRHGDTQADIQANNVTDSPDTLPEEDRTLVGEVDWISLPGTEELEFPVGCSTSTPSGRPNERRVFFRVYGYTLASRIYKYIFDDDEELESTAISENDSLKCTGMDSKKRFGKLSIWRESVVKGFDPDRWIAEKVWVPNPNDGVRIPMFIIRDKSLVKTGNATCVLYGYGGFNVSMTPTFSSTIAAMLTHTGGVFCIACIRGGGEFGQDWSRAALCKNRPVGFADFEECARYLIRSGWTRKEKLVCKGHSNGGLLVGAVMNRAGEELFAGGIIKVGVLDMLRFHRFTVGYAWKCEYGDPDVEDDFKSLYTWSPYHNVRDGKTYQYPAILCVTSDHDDRVVPLHSFKFVAALQHAAGETNLAPLLLRHHVNAGHGGGKSTNQVIEHAIEEFAF